MRQKRGGIRILLRNPLSWPRLLGVLKKYATHGIKMKKRGARGR
jgi:hypothetical protein